MISTTTFSIDDAIGDSPFDCSGVGVSTGSITLPITYFEEFIDLTLDEYSGRVAVLLRPSDQTDTQTFKTTLKNCLILVDTV